MKQIIWLSSQGRKVAINFGKPNQRISLIFPREAKEYMEKGYFRQEVWVQSEAAVSFVEEGGKGRQLPG